MSAGVDLSNVTISSLAGYRTLSLFLSLSLSLAAAQEPEPLCDKDAPRKIPNGRAMMSYDYTHAVSRTYQYKKITKPLLERKRRARINRCLDELKDLMVDALETEGENISKLEKADILELTVRHLQRLQATRPSSLSSSITADDAVAENRWQSGFGHCAAEACRFLSALPGEAAERLARHLAAGLQTNRPSSTSPKPSLLSPTLASLERTANLVAPCSSSSTKNDVATTVNGTVPCRQQSPKMAPEAKTSDKAEKSEMDTESPEDIEETSTSGDENEETVVGKVSTARDRRGTDKSKSNDSQNVAIDDEEEIDVERVDDNDPMWRPW